jgi:superfamily I DNA/RNA helicase
LCAAPKRILAISFKRDAARNLAERVAKRCPPEQARRFNSYTFDAFAKSLVDRFRAAIPEPYRPPADYRIVTPRREDLRISDIHNFPALNTQQLERAIARRDSDRPCRLGASRAVAGIGRQYNDFDIHAVVSMLNRLSNSDSRNPSIQSPASHYPVGSDEFMDTTLPV